MAVALPIGADREVRENGGEPTPDGDGRPVNGGDAGLCWLGPVLGLPADAGAVAEPLADAESLGVAELLAGGAGDGVGGEAEINGSLVVGSGEGDAVAETGSVWH